jgi:hypothetical protein
MTGLGVNQHPVGYWVDMVNTKALLERNGCKKAPVKTQRSSSMIDANQGAHMVGGERYASTIKGNQERI